MPSFPMKFCTPSLFLSKSVTASRSVSSSPEMESRHGAPRPRRNFKATTSRRDETLPQRDRDETRDFT